jgi:hypothetical protein
MRIVGTIGGLAALALSIFSTTVSVAADGDVVGVTTAATLISTGTPPRRAERILEVGTDLFVDERVVTSDSGRLHLMFRDGSSLMVGPKSDLVLDEYVFQQYIEFFWRYGIRIGRLCAWRSGAPCGYA